MDAPAGGRRSRNIGKHFPDTDPAYKRGFQHLAAKKGRPAAGAGMLCD